MSIQYVSGVSCVSVSQATVFIGVIESYEAVHVYQADAFIYTHLIFLYSSNYRRIVMGTTFPPQVKGTC